MTPTDGHQRRANRFTLVCMATSAVVLVLGILAASGGSDAEIVFGYIAFLVFIFFVAPANVLLGTAALYNAWRTGRHAANAWIYGYFGLWLIAALAALVQTGVIEDAGELANHYLRNITDPAAGNFEEIVRRNRALNPEEVATLSELVGAGVDVNGRDGYIGFPYLSYRVSRADVAGTQVLLEAGADPNVRHTLVHTFSGRDSPELNRPSMFTMAAFARGHKKSGQDTLAVLRALTDAGAEPDPVAILGACVTGNRQTFEYLLSLNLTLDAVDGKQQSCLHFAASKGDADLVARLLELGAEPGARSEHGLSPLDYAVRSGEAQVTRLLLDAGADAKWPERVLAFAVSSDAAFGAIRGTTGLDTGTATGDAWWHVLNDCKTTAVAQMIELGASANAESRYGPPLHILARSSCLERQAMLDLLVNAGADLEQRHDGGTAVYAAAREGSGDYLQMLLAAGADIDARFSRATAGPDDDDPTLLGEFARSSSKFSIDAAMLLIRAGATITPEIRANLERAARRSNHAALTALLEQAAAP